MTKQRTSKLNLSKLVAVEPVVAKYTPAGKREYRGNPLIEAIAPPPDSILEAAQRMTEKPHYDAKALRKMSQRQRLDAIDDLDDLYVSTVWHAEKEQRLTSVLLKGLRSRNPLTMTGALDMVHAGDKLKLWRDPAQRPEGSICLILGMSGMGKTSFIKSIARIWGGPVIRHTTYQGKYFDETQIVYLKVNCPADRSLKGLASNLILAVIQLVGPDEELHHMLLNKQVTVSILCNALRYLITTYHIGMLVIDEIRNLFLKSKNSSHDNFRPEDSEIVAFLLNLRDELKIPIVLVGTPEVSDHLDTSLSMNRRITRDGDFTMDPPESASDLNWIMLCTKVFEYQWTLERAGIKDEDFIETLFDLTFGIPGLLVALFQSAQRIAIRLEPKVTRISCDLLKQAYYTEFKRLHAVLDGLKLGDETARLKWNDIWLPPSDDSV